MIHVQHLGTLFGHQNPIYTIACSQKSGILFSAGSDKGVVEWSLKDQAFLKVFFPVQSSVYALHTPIFPNLLIAGERSGHISIFDFEQQKITSVLQHHFLPIFDIKTIYSKNELVVSSEDGTVSIWSFVRELNSYRLLQELQVSTESVRVIAINSIESIIAFGCKDHKISIYDLSTYKLLQVLDSHTLPIASLEFSPDNKYLLSGSRDATLKIWDTTNFLLEKSIPAHLFSIYSIAFHPQQPYFATASRDKSIKIWDARSFDLKKIISVEKGYPSHRLSINKIAWDPETLNLISAGDDKLIMIWNVEFDE